MKYCTYSTWEVIGLPKTSIFSEPNQFTVTIRQTVAQEPQKKTIARFQIITTFLAEHPVNKSI